MAHLLISKQMKSMKYLWDHFQLILMDDVCRIEEGGGEGAAYSVVSDGKCTHLIFKLNFYVYACAYNSAFFKGNVTHRFSK